MYCRDGATTARFLPTLAAAGHGTYRFDASPQMRRRPAAPAHPRPARDLASTCGTTRRRATHPLRIAAAGVEGGDVTLDAGQSSQYLTALLLLGPLTRKGLHITVTDLVSLRAVRRDHAARDDADVRRVRAPGGRGVRGLARRLPRHHLRRRTRRLHREYFFAAAALTGREVVPAWAPARSRATWASSTYCGGWGRGWRSAAGGTTVAGTGELRRLTVDIRDISDTMPTLAAIAPFASGPVRIEDVANTRVKECDRLERLRGELLVMRVDPGPTGSRSTPVRSPCRARRSTRR